ncbi:CLUMA_CG000416, isoform A [Clunio marinus]|uniref:CLUMA_CG000416, isoform A n=1 Tax=Clunio marinus TaxID=568069 RepID=A0A1J1HFU3_9DIPT|nr:CLUMA_CG000416, isoform A [Clunio marinus]
MGTFFFRLLRSGSLCVVDISFPLVRILEAQETTHRKIYEQTYTEGLLNVCLSDEQTKDKLQLL